ncbi:MAG: hypothetical protein ACK5MV_07085 [Aminipila sp.]
MNIKRYGKVRNKSYTNSREIKNIVAHLHVNRKKTKNINKQYLINTLSDLQKTHTETDYSIMTDMEIYKLINRRYERVFPYWSAKVTLNPIKYKEMVRQRRAHLYEAIKDPNFFVISRKEANLRCKEYFGYKLLSNMQIIEEIKKDIPEDGTLEHKIEIMNRLYEMGVISSKSAAAFHINLHSMQKRYFRDHLKNNMASISSVNFEDWIEEDGFEYSTVSWKEINTSIFTNLDISSDYGQEVSHELEQLFERLAEDNRGKNI